MADSSAGPIREKKSRSRRRLEIPCIYQKVATGNKKRKKKSKDGEEDEEMDDEEEQVDPEVVKAKEKPFYSLLTDSVAAQPTQEGSASYGNAGPPDVDQHVSLNTGYQLPFAGSAGESFMPNHEFHHVDFATTATANDYLYHNGVQNGLDTTSSAPFPLHDQGSMNHRNQTAIVPQSRATIETLAANLSPSLVMFTQSLGIDPADTMAHPGIPFMNNMQHLAHINHPSNYPPQQFHSGQQAGQPTSNTASHTLDTIFSPLNTPANAGQFSPHGSSPDTVTQGMTGGHMETPPHTLRVDQEEIEEGKHLSIAFFFPRTSQ
ncbi:hypothetical protein QFC21_005116 [Naganishia friedmannii]|uniref:Uncharacterized protein n=1 Tax=Naganishia friedmannii TaxID=89922 RepID=A0ACC2VCP4_9TREE|nr:hypothetical protein QFC21_005116 [Naganishia friedmannii]